MWDSERREYEKKLHGEIHELAALGFIAGICQFFTGWERVGAVMLGWAAVSLVLALYYAYRAA